MLTPDCHPIDRRIVAKAKTLQNRGFEVIVLATKRRPDEPLGLTYEDVKIHFISPVRSVWNKVSNAFFQCVIRSTDKLLLLPYLVSNNIKSALFGVHAKVARDASWRKILKSYHPVLLILLVSNKLLLKVAGLFCRPKNIVLARLQHFVERLCWYFEGINPEEKAFFEEAMLLRPDIIEANDLPTLRPAIEVKRKLKIPLVYDMHEIYFSIDTISPIRRFELRRRERRLLKEVDLAITVNPLAAQMISKLHKCPPPFVVQNAVGRNIISAGQSKPNLFREEFPSIGSRTILLYQGWITSVSSRNLVALIKAIHLVADECVLVMMGYGENAFFEDLIRSERLENAVFIKPAVSQSELLKYTASADIGIIPYSASADLNTSMASPNKLYEFIQAHLPILSNDLAFVRSIVEVEGFGEVIDFSDKDLFSKTCRKMRGQLSNYLSALEEKSQIYSWETEEKKYLEPLNRILHSPIA